MTARFVQWARSSDQVETMIRDGWECDTDQPITHHHVYSVLMHWPHDDRDPPNLPVDQQHFHSVRP